MKKIIYLLAIATLTLTSCDVNDPIIDPSSEKIKLTTDWSQIGDGISKPASYTVLMGDYNATLSGDENELSGDFATDNYKLSVYNTADKISVSGTAATVASNNNIVETQPGWFFTAYKDVALENGVGQDITAIMQQQV